MENRIAGKNLGWILATLSIVLLCGVYLAACASGPAPAAAPTVQELSTLSSASLGRGEKLRVIATTNIVADVVSRIGGDAISLTALLPVGTDPHAYQATPQDLLAVVEAHVVFISGLGLQENLVELIANAGGQAVIVPVSTGVETIAFGGESEPDHEGADPHVWLDPNNVIVWARNIEHTLSAQDPANGEIYQTNADRYVEALQALDGWIRIQVALVPEEKRELVTDHLIFGYFARRYGFKQVGAVIAAFSTMAEPSAQDMAELQDTIREFDVAAIIVGTTVNSRLAEQIAKDTGIQIVRVYTGSLSGADGEAGTYIDYMRYNVDAIVGALR